MRKIKLLATVLRITGVIILCLALVLSLYGIATSAKSWKTMNTYMGKNKVEMGFADRMRFDHELYTVMNKLAWQWKSDDETLKANPGQKNEIEAGHKQAVVDAFLYLNDRVVSQREENSAAEMKKALNSYRDAAYAKTLLERCEVINSNSADQELKKIYEKINSMSKPPKGKALNVDYTQQCRDFYDTLVQEHGEEAVGSFVEFSNTLLSMFTEYKNNKGVNIIDKYLVADFSYEKYQQELVVTRATEMTEDSENLVQQFSVLLAEVCNGNEADFEAFYVNARNTFIEMYPQQEVPSLARFTCCLHKLLTNEKAKFFGSYEELVTALAEEAKAYEAAGFDVFLSSTFVPELLTDTEGRKEVRFGESKTFPSRVSIPSVLWFLVASVWYLWFLGIVLIILSIVVNVILNRYVLKKCKAKKQEEMTDDSDVLLKVEHVKQYFRSKGYVNKAVDDVSFEIRKGEVFGLVGESGCGKTTTGRTIINLYDPTDGDVYFKGQRISTTEKGLSTLLKQLKNDYKQAVRA